MEISCLFLGTGSAMGVPEIGCRCSVCLSSNPKNSRLRSSILLTVNGKKYLIDPSIDHRQQSLKFKIEKIDAVLITHMHYDHVGGLDDLRAYTGTIPFILSQESYQIFTVSYPYLRTALDSRWRFHLLEENQELLLFQGEQWGILNYMQKEIKVTGFRIGNFAYLIDIKDFPPKNFPLLQGLDALVISAYRQQSSAHLSREESLAIIAKIGAKKTWLSHISHQIDQEQIDPSFPPSVHLAYDGLEIYSSLE